MARIGIVFGDTVIMSEPGATSVEANEQELLELVQRQQVKVEQCLSAARLLLGVADGLQNLELNADHVVDSIRLSEIPAQGKQMATVTPIRPSCYGLGS